jgi:hypothetical protein
MRNSGVVRHLWARLAKVLLITILAACGTSSEPEQSPCERLREHVLDVSVVDIVGEYREQHRAALQESMGDFVPSCTAAFSETQIACALEARTASAVQSCTSN